MIYFIAINSVGKWKENKTNKNSQLFYSTVRKMLYGFHFISSKMSNKNGCNTWISKDESILGLIVDKTSSWLHICGWCLFNNFLCEGSITDRVRNPQLKLFFCVCWWNTCCGSWKWPDWDCSRYPCLHQACFHVTLYEHSGYVSHYRRKHFSPGLHRLGQKNLYHARIWNKATFVFPSYGRNGNLFFFFLFFFQKKKAAIKKSIRQDTTG